MPLAKLAPGELTLTSSEPAYYSLRRTLVRREPRPEPLARGFHIERAYLDAESGQPLTRARLGQLVRVRVTVTPDAAAHYVAVDDPIPAGCEIVNTELATEGTVGRDPSRSYYFDHQALHDDRADAFADEMPAGAHVFEYLMRPTLAGSYSVPPAMVEAMYEPARMARTGALAFEVVP